MFAEHVPELANIAAGAFVFGQVLADRPYSMVIAMLGIVIWLALMGLAALFTTGD